MSNMTPQELYDWLVSLRDEDTGYKPVHRALRLHPDRRRQLHRLTTVKGKTNIMISRMYRLRTLLGIEEEN